MTGWKTKAGAALVALAGILEALGYHEWAKVVVALGAALSTVGVAHKVEKAGGAKTAAKALLLVALLGLGAAGCRTLSDADVRLIRTHKAANAAHAADETLPAEARLVAREAYDAFCVLDYSATGAEVPADVRARTAEAR